MDGQSYDGFNNDKGKIEDDPDDKSPVDALQIDYMTMTMSMVSVAMSVIMSIVIVMGMRMCMCHSMAKLLFTSRIGQHQNCNYDEKRCPGKGRTGNALFRKILPQR